MSRIQSEISRRRKAGSKHEDILNAIMNIREVKVPDYDICCIMVAWMVAASATTVALVSWVLKYLEMFPEVHQRVQVKSCQWV